ncbi:calponin homology domain-containing protein DDB_G0272472 isoform X2 [Perca flavescens]|uniref:calponin homology domain-containing protein DDB_G0272472 isoform X2 n=1 Tax=Perca flavescens TaxID=8167 RepID=UPI00106ECF98|nr:calponin homology domain-containing protein DDB_G0272472-like isoform X2 [Perca flavescens]
MSLIEIPSINQSHILSPEPNKPVPGPKPRLTPKPFAVERNPTIKPILAPKPQTKPRPESTRLPGCKPEPPFSPVSPEPVATGKASPASINPNRPCPTFYKSPNKLNTGQTTKPIVQPFKPTPPLDPGDSSKPTPPVTALRKKPGSSNLAYSKSLKQPPAAEWSGNTKTKDETKPMRSSKCGVSITRAKSMGFLNLVGQEEEEEEKEKANPAAAAPLRPQPRGSRPRPVSAIFLDSPPKTETPVPAPRSARRPLSADLTAKFESIGLSLHRPSPKANTKENTPEEKALPQKREQEKTPKSPTPQSTDGVAQPAVSDQSNKKAEEKTVKETDDEEKRAVSIKSRISLLLDSSSSPGTGVAGQGSELHSPVQPVPETEPQVGVKQLIKQLIEDTTPTQSPVVKLPLKPRPLPLDLTKRFSTERSPDLGSVSLSEATDRHEISKDPQRRIEEPAITPSDQRTFADLKDSQEPLKKASAPEGPEAGQTFGAAFKESSPSSDLQTVRASLFENVVERHSVLMVEEGQPANAASDSLSSPSFKRGNGEDDGTLVTATYREPVSPSCLLQVFHAFDTVQAVEENRAVSENIPSAQWEDKAMTLRSRRSEGSRPVTERTGSAPCEPALAAMPEPQPRYLRVGALPKWTTASLKREESVEKGMLKGSQREGQVALDQDRDRQREAEQEEVAAAPKRLKMLQTEEQLKPRATYFALTGQIQEPVSPLAAGGNVGGDTAGPFGNFSVTSAAVGSQGKVLPMRRNPSLDKAFGKNSHDQVEELMMRSHREVRSASDGQTTEDLMEVEKKRELKKETERHMARMKEFEREKQRQLEMEKEAHLEFARMKERELQREFERQRQKAFEKEKQDFEEKQRALERQKQLELEQKQQLQELERARLRELEKERQRHLEKEKRRELERQRREKVREQEKERQREQERQRQREEERQSELDKERRLLEIQKEKQKMEELERIKELETLQLLEFQKQKQKEKERQQLVELEKQRLKEKKEREEADKLKQMALEQEMLKMKELERQREMEKEHQKEIEREKQRELERQRHRDIERERQRQLDLERQELENQRLRQRELEKERQRKEEMERIREVERRQFLELEKQKQAERDRLQMLELEKRRLRERMEREEADQMRQIAKQQEAERQRLKEREERQKKEEQERARLETSPLRPKVLDLDSVLRNEPLSRAASQRSDPATRWKELSPRAEEVYKPAILDIDSFTSQAQLSPSKDLFPVSGIQGVDTGFGARLQPAPDVDVSWRVPPQASVGFTSPGWTTSPQDPWELRPVEMSVDKPVAEPRKHGNKVSPEQLLLRQEDRLLAPQRHWSAVPDEPLRLAPLPGTEAKSGGSPGGVSSSAPAEQIWLPREPPPQESSRGEVRIPRRSQGSQEQQKQSVGGEEEGQDSGTPVRDSDSQYGTWETGLRTDDSLSPATPTSESNLSPSPRKPTPPHTPGDRASQFDTDALDSLPPSSSAESQQLPFPEAPTTLLDTSALRSRAHLVKKRAPRTRPSRAARQTAALSESEGGTTEDWLYRDSTEAKAESKDDDSDSEERARGADASPAVSSQPQRVAMFPGMDPSALKAQLKKRSDSDNQIDGPTPSPSQLSRSPKSPFLPRAARVLPPPGGKENGEEDSPQWLKELKSKKRLSQYENDC